MKVRGTKRTGRAVGKPTKIAPTPDVTFEEIMAVTEDKQETDRLDTMLDDISKKGRELAEKRDVEILLAYKEMVSQFIEEAVNHGLKVVEKRGFGRAGRSKIMRVVSQIDENLIELTEEMIKNEQSSIRLLTKIGAIQGLLLNLYA